MTSYAIVETALARMHGADSIAQKGAFRGRLKHLQRLGLPLGDKPGKGKRIDYTMPQIWQLALALELSEFGLDPNVTSSFISHVWDINLEEQFNSQVSANFAQSKVMTISVSLMSASWRPLEETMYGLVSIGWRDKFADLNGLFYANNPRAMVIDTWKMLRDLREILAELEVE